jgi:hypothetical protein
MMNAESEEELALDLSLVSVHMLTCPARAAARAATLARWDLTDWGKLCGRPRVHLDDSPESAEAAWGDAQRGTRIVAAFAKMLEAATDDPDIARRQQATRGTGPGGWLRGDAYFTHRIYKMERECWLLLLEDDLDFHPRIGAALAAWDAAREGVMRTLFDPGLKAVGGRQKAEDREDNAERDPQAANSPSSSAYCLPPAACCSRSFAADPRTFLGAQALFIRSWFARHALERWNSVTGMQSQRLAKLHQELPGPMPILVHRPSLVQHLPVDGGSGWGARVQQALDFDPSWSPPLL